MDNSVRPIGPVYSHAFLISRRAPTRFFEFHRSTLWRDGMIESADLASEGCEIGRFKTASSQVSRAFGSSPGENVDFRHRPHDGVGSRIPAAHFDIEARVFRDQIR
jgi:hypothetical protein